MAALKYIWVLFLLACAYTSPYDTSSERTVWEVCWTSEGNMVVPNDYNQHNYACKSPEIIKWKLPIRVGFDERIPLYYRNFVVRAYETWNSEVGVVLFIGDDRKPDVTVKPIANPFYYAITQIQKKTSTYKAEVLISVQTWNDPRLYFTAVHEFGHVLGLAHDNFKSSWMYSGDREPVMRITEADIKALRRIYDR